MSSDLDTYKQNRINENNAIFNDSVSRLYSAVISNIRALQRSRQNNNVKQRQISFLTNQYYSNVNNLKSNLDKSILSIKNFVPKTITINKNKKALLIGINYTGTSNELYGCINDTTAIKERISKQGFNDITVITDLTTKKATRNNILEGFKNLLMNCQAGDFLFFVYSGHGSYAIDRNGDEKDGRDELIVSCDLQGILDDELKALIQTYLKADVTLFALFDCCFSGSVLDLKYQFMDSLDYDKFTENSKQLETQGNVIMISGCTDNQTAADAVFGGKAAGAMTWSLLESLKQKPNINWRELVKTMRDLLKTSQFTQIPQFSSGNFVDIDKEIFI
jgi:uncharacterized caspase-like protein